MTVTAASHLEPVFEPVIEKAGFKLGRLRIMGGITMMVESSYGSQGLGGENPTYVATISTIVLVALIAAIAWQVWRLVQRNDADAGAAATH